MVIRGVDLLKSYRGRILLSFFSFFAILLIWMGIYSAIKTKEEKLQDFSHQLTQIQNSFFASNNSLQFFILSGFHQTDFYKTGRQKDIDTFESYLEKNLQHLYQARKEARKNNIDLDVELDRLVVLDARLMDSVRLLKSLYLEKGFKDFGLEGKMRLYAHILEDSSLIKEVSILQLRRHEKDYLIRGDTLYAREFVELIDQLTNTYPPGSHTRALLGNYKFYFNKLVEYTNRLGINSSYGTYYHVQQIIGAIETQYTAIRTRSNLEAVRLRGKLKTTLITASAGLLVIAILLSLFLSNALTRDIKELNERMFAFINSRFREDKQEHDDHFLPKIKDIEQLNKAFLHLKSSLKDTLENLEKSYEQEKKSSEYKSIFLANMSHEIRTPLNGITGMTHIIRNTELSAEQMDCLNTIDFSANHLLELINRILDYSKIESGNMELEHIPIDLKGDLSKVLNIFKYKLLEKRLQLFFTYKAANDRYVLGDPLRLQQVLLNLIGNAIKFTNEGSIDVRLIEQPSPDRFHQVIRFEIEDTGIGISQDNARSLFEAFKQADASITRNFGGTGLGLTISDQLVKLMGGKLEVESKPGSGTTFFFTLQLPLGEPIRYPMEENSAQHKEDFSGTRILLAEDNLINQKVFCLMLAKYKITVDIANNGQEACDMYEQFQYDLVFMDIQMPVMDGYQAAQQIRQSGKYQYNHTPIIAITANAFQEDREKAMEAGMNDFLIKPVRPLELEGILAKYHLAVWEG